MKQQISLYFPLFILTITSAHNMASDANGVQKHPMIERYPGQEIRWQKIENDMPYEIPVGPVTGYRKIDNWITTQGCVSSY